MKRSVFLERLRDAWNAWSPLEIGEAIADAIGLNDEEAMPGVGEDYFDAAKRVLAERDEAVARAEEAERERDEARKVAAERNLECGRWAAWARSVGVRAALLTHEGMREALSEKLRGVNAKTAAPAPQPASEPSEVDLAKLARETYLRTPAGGSLEDWLVVVRTLRARLRPVVTEEMVRRATIAYEDHDGNVRASVRAALVAALGADAKGA